MTSGQPPNSDKIDKASVQRMADRVLEQQQRKQRQDKEDEKLNLVSNGMQGFLDKVAANSHVTGIDKERLERILSGEEEIERVDPMQEVHDGILAARHARLMRAIPGEYVQWADPAHLKPLLQSWEWEHSLFIYGPYGSGKTHQAAALVKQTAHMFNNSVEWFHSIDLIDALRDAQFERGPMPNVFSCQLLVIDDLGAVEELSKFAKEQLTKIVDTYYREGGRKLLITSNFDMDSLARVVGERIIDRLRQMCFAAELSRVEGSWRKELSPNATL